MSIALKSDGRVPASIVGLQPELLVAAMVADGVFTELGRLDAEHNVECVITSGLDGEHSHRGSDHYIGCALDFRIRHLENDAQAELAADRIRARLGEEFFVRLESDHIHVGLIGRPRV